MALEEPKHTTLLHEGAFELRDYAASVVAEVSVAGDQRTAGNQGFRKLAAYIFGGNARAQRIPMTAPVKQSRAEGEGLVRFTMPGSLALADLPQPKDPAIHLKALPAGRFAVLRFSGLAREAGVAAQGARLMAFVKARGLVPTGPITLARYDPPWMPWFLRRNEVMLPVQAG